jgi:hypothetical protein
MGKTDQFIIKSMNNISILDVILNINSVLMKLSLWKQMVIKELTEI